MSASLSKAQTSAPAAAVAPALVVELLGAADLLQVSGPSTPPPPPPPPLRWEGEDRVQGLAVQTAVRNVRQVESNCFYSGMFCCGPDAPQARCSSAVRSGAAVVVVAAALDALLLPAAGLIINQLCCGASRWLPGFPGVFWSKHA